MDKLDSTFNLFSGVILFAGDFNTNPVSIVFTIIYPRTNRVLFLIDIFRIHLIIQFIPMLVRLMAHLQY